MPNTRALHHERPLAIYYEHPEWFLPLFAELDRRGIAYNRLLAHQHCFDPAVRESPYALIVNRMSPWPSSADIPRRALAHCPTWPI
jgi:hypothetical protein